VRILHWLEISNFKSYRSSGRMPLEGQVRRFGGFARVALRKLAILDGSTPICTFAVSWGSAGASGCECSPAMAAVGPTAIGQILHLTDQNGRIFAMQIA